MSSNAPAPAAQPSPDGAGVKRGWLPRNLRSPAVQTALVITVTVALALSAGIALMIAKFDRTLSDTVESRFKFTAQELRDSIETGLDLGLSLTELDNVQRIIDQRNARDNSVVRITVEDTAGDAVFSSEADGAAATDGPRRRIGAPLVNAFGKTVGRVEVVYVVSTYSGTVDTVANILARWAIALTLISAVIAAIGCTLLLRRLPRRLARVRTWCNARRVTDAPAADPIETTLAEAVETSNAVVRELADLAEDHGPDQVRERNG